MSKDNSFIIEVMQRNIRVLITGSPGAGKTTIIEGLKNKGYSTFSEFSRSLIQDAKIKGITDFFLSDPFKFSQKLLEERKKQFHNSESIIKAKGKIVFFDRGIHDIYAYLKAIGKKAPEIKTQIYSFKYDLVFLLDPWEEIFKKDNERLESFEEAENYYVHIKKVYNKQHKVIKVPQSSINERIFFIESFFKQNG